MSDAAPRILCIANQKGGVGKTTTTINLAAALASFGHRILVLDLDPQGNASTGLGILNAARDNSMYDVVVEGAPLRSTIQATGTERIDIVPATQDLSSIDLQLAGQRDRVTRLKTAVQEAGRLEYDFVLIDCPPSLNLLTVNALVAADGVLVPLQCEFFALEGISQLLKTIQEIRQSTNPALKTEGIVLTMYDSRNNLTNDVEEDVRETLGALVFNTVIPRNVRLSEAPSYGIPALKYDPKSTGSRAYIALANELCGRMPALAAS